MSFLSKILGDDNQKFVKQTESIVQKINNLENEISLLSDDRLKERSLNLIEALKNGKTLDDVLEESFALIRESAKRTLNQRHFDVQLIGGIALHKGKIAEMRTGEGKTLAATAPAYLNALSKKGVHIVTVNDYLAKRDAVWMGQIYHLLGLSVGCIAHESAFLYDPTYKAENIEEMDKQRDEAGSFKVMEDYLKPVSRKEAYLADITYGTNHEFGFDYLRDNMIYDQSQKAQRELSFAIIDEVDSILIDEARTPLIISAPDTESSAMYRDFAKIIPQLKSETDYQMFEKEKAVTLTEEGILRIEKILGTDNIYEDKGVRYLHYLEQSLRAEVLFKKDRDYVVKDGQIIIIDEFTGRLMHGRRWSGGLHQAMEAKEGLNVQAESITLATISIQNYFRMYAKLAGMTGTALTSAEEFGKVYNLDVIVIPTNRPMVRKDSKDAIYKTEKAKLDAIVERIKECYKNGQPVLVGTRSIEKNEHIGKLLSIDGIPHNILNAKNHQREGEIIAQAGKLGAVTVATNMAGRGVDIILGGNPSDEKEAEKVKGLGGLLVIGTERHDARRIDNQLRGRSGRQGDPGESQFFLSLEDDLMRIFAKDRIGAIMERFNFPEDQPIESGIISKAIESAQSQIEGMNFDVRRHLLEYDDVMNVHRDTFYKKRNEILSNSLDVLKERINEAFKDDKGKLLEKEKEIGEKDFWPIARYVALRSMDNLWIGHLEEMEYLRDQVRLRAYGQMDPVIEYKNEGYKMFNQLLKMIDDFIVKSISNITVKTEVQKPKEIVNAGDKKIGRNDSCPCGSGKKYKKCCGR
ncbi:MAG: preprotein translocase subunit SecA [Candidatus Pacebacteria bacterium]|nr:preprotein translocase subunit SecA [Candidatus Paceibacterota bacterium]